MAVREATPVDEDAIRDVHYRSITELATDAYTQEQVDAWASACERANYVAPIEDADVAFLVAETGDEIVGFGSLAFGTPEWCEFPADAQVTGVYVAPRVSRDGVGSAIYDALEDRARERQGEGERDVRVLGLLASVNAVPFYEHHGYEHVREVIHEFGGTVEGPAVAMRKSL